MSLPGAGQNHLLGFALAATVLPSLESEAVSDVDINVLLKRISSDTVPSFMMTLPELVRLKKVSLEQAVNIIHEKLIGRDKDTVQAAINAVRWFQIVSEKNELTMPEKLIEEVVSICVMQREPGFRSALAVLYHLVTDANGISLSKDNKNRLLASLCVLAKQTDYQGEIEEAIQHEIGLIRKEALKLASALKKSGAELPPEIEQWIIDSSSDPLPEVRYALISK